MIERWIPQMGDKVRLLRTSPFSNQAEPDDMGEVVEVLDTHNSWFKVRWSSGKSAGYRANIDIIPYVPTKSVKILSFTRKDTQGGDNVQDR